MIRTSGDGEIIEEGWYKELHVTEPILYEYPNYVFEEDDPEKLTELKKQLNHKTTKSAKSVKSTLKRRYIITWTPSRAAKDRKDRERLIKKADLLIAQPSCINDDFNLNERSFVIVDMQPETAGADIALIEEQDQFSGIRIIETSLSSTVSEVLAIYEKRQHIESDFSRLDGLLSEKSLPGHVSGSF